ncbi:hypothetical protein PR003_g11911 [Phytophthora rubi]|uniref:Uncharacterized protein n=1 Tax=Phytophthora rubi TaxID=129364 RepID=A0A6A3MHT3_9STRA|nr:hypothetical protein PR001_g11508 [Phytophthora rubi]KAE9337638.1 hypothetical protein PR003_g11911 [Phytophthora rubi]
MTTTPGDPPDTGPPPEAAEGGTAGGTEHRQESTEVETDVKTTENADQSEGTADGTMTGQEHPPHVTGQTEAQGGSRQHWRGGYPGAVLERKSTSASSRASCTTDCGTGERRAYAPRDLESTSCQAIDGDANGGLDEDGGSRMDNGREGDEGPRYGASEGVL